MRREIAPSYSVRIYVAGDGNAARQWLRHECIREGLCVTVKDVDYIYTYGLEAGVEVGLENYPRFPKTPAELQARAEVVATGLMQHLGQSSCMVVTPSESVWLTNRPI